MSGPKRRTAPTVELIGVAIASAMALSVQLQAASTSIRTATPAAPYGSRPTLIIK